MALPKTIKQAARDKLWKSGILSFMLHSGQQDLYELYHNSSHKVQVWLISRRFGKTYTLCTLALEQCIRQKNSIVKFIAPTKTQVNNIVRPLFRQILEDCPKEIMPEFKSKDWIYYFPNGSEIQLAGSDGGHAEKLRGGESNLAFIDEAGDCDDLEHIIKDILLPTTLHTGGKIILSGTPPRESDHEFLNFIETADSKGALIKKTIRDNPRLTPDQIKMALDEMGGEFSESSQREFFCEIMKDSKSSVIPEFTDDLITEIVIDWERPAHFDAYQGMDLGGKDLTVNLFSYFDFRNNRIVIEDEIVMNFQEKNNTIDTLVKQIQAKEEALYFNKLTNEQQKVYKRVSDIDYIVLNEIKKISNYQISFEAAKKDNLEAMVNFLREKLKKKEIVIHPRCTTLIRHLKNVKWKKGEKAMFARSPDDGHYDAVAALLYLIRIIDYKRNPYPAGYGIHQKDLFGNVIEARDSTYKSKARNLDLYKSLFNIKVKK